MSSILKDLRLVCELEDDVPIEQSELVILVDENLP